MADVERADQQHPSLHLTPEERRLFGQLFAQADADKLGVVTGERAVNFFEKTRLNSDTLGEIWQIADQENRGLLTPAGFGIVLRLIGWAQAGRPLSMEMALKPGGPLPKFEGIQTSGGSIPAAAQPLQQQNSGTGPIRVPPLTPDRVSQYTSLFEESGAQNGVLPGETAKSIFERAQLPNETLGKIWALSDTEQKGALGLTEFIIAMHLLACMRNGSMRALPQVLPAGLYEAAARRGAPPQGARSRPTSDNVSSAIPRQFSGQGFQSPQRATFQQPVAAGEQWAVSPQDKVQFDSIFATVDTQNRGFITGDQAVTFFSNSRLPEEALAQIWDLADINSEGQLNREEFAVAMYLIRQQRSKTAGRDVLPQQLPPNLIPPSMRRQPIAPQQPTAPAFDNAANISAPKSASEDLFGLDAISTPQAAPLQPKSTGDSSNYATPPRNQASPPPTSQPSSHFKPFVPSSSFGQSILPNQATGTSVSASPATARSVPQPQQQSAADDLLGDPDPEVSKRLTTETTDLANLSSQVSTLTGQMQDVRNKHGATGQELNQAQNQKRQFEARLAELRAGYEKEVKEVRSLEERLRSSRTETQKLQSDMAMLSGTHEDLRTQHQQVSQALTADQNDNTNLKERIRQASVEVEQLKPQLEKMRSDARHQKGLVAINKKQLATHEAEREKIRGELEGTRVEHEEATRELEQSQRDLESTTQAKASQPAVSSPAPVTSPAPSSASMNPFFRRPSNPPPAERGSVASPLIPPNVTSPNHNAFDSFFGPSAGASTPPPPTSFRSDSPSVPRDEAKGSQPSASGIGSATPPTSPPQSVSTDSPATASEPPAPPQSRQITSSFLPLRPQLEHSGSESSSVKVIPPASRMGERVDMSSRAPSEAPAHESPLQHFQEAAYRSMESPSQFTPSSSGQQASVPDDLARRGGPPSAPQDLPGAFPGDETPIERSQPDMFATSKSPYSNTGLDPRVDPRATPGGEQPPQLQPGASDPFGKSSTPTSAKDDFESAFEGFTGDKGKAPERTNGAVSDDPFAPSAPAQPASEFPPIRELEDDSESESETGFDDDFTARTANKRKESGPNEAFQGQSVLSGFNGLAPSRPPYTSSDSIKSDLPTPNAQASPPTYDQTIGSPGGTIGDRKSSNQFPAEYSGLLPSRDDPISPPSLPKQNTLTSETPVASSANPDPGLDFFPKSNSPPIDTSDGATLSQQRSPMAPGASMNATYAYISNQSPFDPSNPSSPQDNRSQPQPPIQPFEPASLPPPTVFQSTSGTAQPQSQPPVPAKVPPTPKDDFDDFEGLAPAQEDEDDVIDFGRHSVEEGFNPTFDSPQAHHTAVPSQASNITNTTTNTFEGFQPNANAVASHPNQGAKGLGSDGGGTSGKESVSHDWDAIFAGLDASPNANANATAGDAFEPKAPINGSSSGGHGAGLGLSSDGQGLGGTSSGFGSPGGVNSGLGGQSVENKGSAGLKKSTTVDSTEGDDPILMRLMGMGFKRNDSLKALERYDYNIDKAAEYLLAKSGS